MIHGKQMTSENTFGLHSQVVLGRIRNTKKRNYIRTWKLMSWNPRSRSPGTQTGMPSADRGRRTETATAPGSVLVGTETGRSTTREEGMPRTGTKRS